MPHRPVYATFLTVLAALITITPVALAGLPGPSATPATGHVGPVGIAPDEVPEDPSHAPRSGPNLAADVRPTDRLLGDLQQEGWITSDGGAPGPRVDAPALNTEGAKLLLDGPQELPGLPQGPVVPTSAQGQQANLSRNVTPHDPITIRGDVGPTGFVLGYDPTTGEPIYRPGSGVVDGRGIAADPFVIAGWHVEGILLADTTRHVVVRDNVILGPSDEATRDRLFEGGGAVLVEDAEHVRITRNTVIPEDVAIDVEDSKQIHVTHNNITHATAGITLRNVDVATVSHNHVTRSWEGIQVSDGHQVTVASNHLRGLSMAVAVGGGSNIIVSENRIEVSWFGVDLINTETVTARGNVLLGNRYAMDVSSSSKTVLDGNTFEGGVRGVHAQDTAGLDIVGNRFTETRSAIYLDEVEGTVAFNHILEGMLGVITWDGDLRIHGNNITRTRYVAVGVDGGDARITSNDLRGNAEGIVAFLTSPTIRGNLVEGGDAGVLLYGARGADLQHNLLTGTSQPLVVFRSPNVHLEGNTLQGGGLELDGWRSQDLHMEVGPDNTVDGDPLVYLRNTTNVFVAGTVGQVILVDPIGSGVRDAVVGTGGITVHGGEDILIENVTVQGAGWSTVRFASTSVELRDVTVDVPAGGAGVFASEGTDLDATGLTLAPAGNRSGSLGIVSWESHVTLHRSTLEDLWVGVLAFYGDVNVEESTVRGVRLGAVLVAAEPGSFIGTRVETEVAGIVLESSPLQRLHRLDLVGGGLLLWGDGDDHRHNVTDVTVNGKPLAYHHRDANVTVDPNAGQVIVAQSRHVQVEGLNITEGTAAVTVVGSRDVEVTNNRLGSVYGVIASGSDVTLRGNHIRANVGAYLVDVPNRGLVEENTVDARSSGSVGIVSRGYGDANVTISANEVRDGIAGVVLSSTERVHVRGNTLDGGLLLQGWGNTLVHDIQGNTVDGRPIVYLHDATNATVDPGAAQVIVVDSRNVRVDGVSAPGTVPVGVQVAGSSNVTLHESSLHAWGAQVVVLDSRGFALEDSHLEGGRFGVQLAAASDVRFSNVHLTGASYGVYGSSIYDVRLDHVTLRDHRVGMWVWSGHGITVEESNITGNHVGIELMPFVDEMEVHGSNLHDNHVGLDGGYRWWDKPVVNATGNWWGCETGPNTDGCSSVQGSVNVDPWLRAPNPSAGARLP